MLFSLSLGMSISAAAALLAAWHVGRVRAIRARQSARNRNRHDGQR